MDLMIAATPKFLRSCVNGLALAVELPPLLGHGRTLSVALAGVAFRHNDALCIPLAHRLMLRGLKTPKDLAPLRVGEFTIIVEGCIWTANLVSFDVTHFAVIGQEASVTILATWAIRLPESHVKRLAKRFRTSECDS